MNAVFVICAFFLVVLVSILIVNSLVIVSRDTVAIVVREGKVSRILKPGVHFIVPGESIKTVRPLRTEIIEVFQSCITKDLIRVGIDLVIFIKVIDPVKAYFNDPHSIVKQLTELALKKVVSKYNFTDILESRDKVAVEVKAILSGINKDWGIDILQIEVKDVQIPQDLLMVRQAEIKAKYDNMIQKMRVEAQVYALKRIIESLVESIKMIEEADPNLIRDINLKHLHQDLINKLNQIISTSHTSDLTRSIQSIESMVDEFAKKYSNILECHNQDVTRQEEEE